MSIKYNATLHIQLVEVRQLDTSPNDFFSGGPFQVILEVLEPNSKTPLWKHKSATVQATKPPVVFKEKAHVTNLPALECDHDNQPNCKLELFLCKQKGNKWFKDNSTINLNDLVVNKQEEKVITLEKKTAAVVLRLRLSNSEVPTDNVNSLSELRHLSLTPSPSNGHSRNNSNNSLASPYSHSFVNLAFAVNYHTQLGEVLCVVGSIPKLGSWDPTKGLKMNWNEGGSWTLEVSFRKSDTPFDYKYVVYNTHSHHTRWETTPNRKFSLDKHPDQPRIVRDEAWEVI